MAYLIIVQPKDAAKDHWLSTPSAGSADSFAKWVHKETGAAVSVYDERHDLTRLVLGDFAQERT